MVKGFVFYRGGKIPFVIEDYRMELFSDDSLLSDFAKEHNFKMNYTLNGQYFRHGFEGQRATFLVEYSMAGTCYLTCYILYNLGPERIYDTVGFQSPFLDDAFRYNYEYLDMVRAGHNLETKPRNIYDIPFSMNGRQYELTYRIGHDNHLGLLEDTNRKGEALVGTQTEDIQELNDLSIVFNRLAMFMVSQADVSFKRITLYKNEHKIGWFYSPLVSDKAVSVSDFRFCRFDVMKYLPKILNNIALDSGNRISQSIPLGHLQDADSLFSPRRFMEQVMAFEYLFDKLEPQKAKDRKFPLKDELKYMLNEFPKLLSGYRSSSGQIGEQIKELRRSIAHGHAYYYDFKTDIETQRLIFLLDKLIRNMSLLWIGFSKEEIAEYPLY